MSNEQVSNEGIAPNAKRLLWAGFMAIFAAGMGFGIRGGIFDNWGSEFGFTATQLGAIGGAGFTGFCFGIIIGGVICDKIGYSKLVIAAFALHVLSAVVTFMANTPANAYQMLTIGMFIFAFANGTLEAVANPLVATLFPKNRTHFLNILHASWPAGIVAGAAVGWVLDDKMNVHWKVQLALYLVPTVIYGFMFLGQHMPKSEASQKGANLGEMLKDVGLIGAAVACYLLSMFVSGPLASLFGMASFPESVGYGVGLALLIGVGVLTKFSIGSVVLFVLFLTHALVGAVELGTDGWIANITGNMFSSEQGKWLLIWTSTVMFSLRFCAHFIETKLGLSPVALLLVCSVLACVGLQMTSGVQTVGMAFVALTIYAIGKTFFWPTMLAVVSDRYPSTGAVAISIMGGIGMLSAIMGVGGGFMLVPAMIYILGMPTAIVIGTSLFQVVFVSANVTLLQAWQVGSVDIVLTLLLLAGGVAGAQFGAAMGTKLRGEETRALLGLLVLAVAFGLAWNLLQTPSRAFTLGPIS